MCKSVFSLSFILAVVNKITHSLYDGERIGFYFQSIKSSEPTSLYLKTFAKKETMNGRLLDSRGIARQASKRSGSGGSGSALPTV